MKTSIFAVGLCLLMAVLLGDVAAKRKKGNRGNNDCSDWTMQECVPNEGTCGKGKKLGTRTGSGCRVTEKQFKCRVPCEGDDQEDSRCSLRKDYDRSEPTECDLSVNLQNVTFTLKDQSNSACHATLVKSLECRGVGADGKKLKKGCKFVKGDWEDECDATGHRTRTDTLKKAKRRAPPEGCADSRQLLSPCIMRERKPRGLRKKDAKCSDWTFGECVLESGTCGKGKKMGTRTGDECRLTEKEFRCKIPCRSGGCPKKFYEKSEWSECDTATYLKTQTLTLKQGSNALCPATKALSKKCRVQDENGKKLQPACKFSKGSWSECDESTGMKTRVDSLVKARGDQFCADTRTLSKLCK